MGGEGGDQAGYSVTHIAHTVCNMCDSEINRDNPGRGWRFVNATDICWYPVADTDDHLCKKCISAVVKARNDEDVKL